MTISRRVFLVTFIWSYLAVPVLCGSVFGRDTWVVGEGGKLWKPATTLYSVEVVDHRLQPQETDTLENVAKSAAKIWSPQSMILGDLTSMLTDEVDSTMWVIGDNMIGASLRIDLGGVYGINRIVLYPGLLAWSPGEPEECKYMRGYEIYLNDGDPGKVFGGEPIYTLVTRSPRNKETVIDCPFPLQYARYIKIVNTAPEGFAIIQVDINGRGFSPIGRYVSDVIDLGSSANFGRIKLSADVPAKTRIVLQTKTGLTPEPYFYYKKAIRPGEEDVKVPKSQYDRLPGQLKGRVEENLEDWDSWSAPYTNLEGQMTSTGNRRYIQFMLEFHSTDVASAAVARAFSLEYSTPAVAHRVIGEISPGEVDIGQTATFDYYVRSEISGDDTGFDALEVLTPFRAMFRGLKIGGVPVDVDSVDISDDWLMVHFPQHRVEADELLQLTFDCMVAVSGTSFPGRVFDSQTEEFPQDVVPGDAIPEVRTDGLITMTPLGPELSSPLDVVPNPFTPNSDGENDATTVSYTILKLKALTPVTVSIYDLGGNVVRTLHSSKVLNGPYTHSWDGLDDEGRLVSPGVYICRLVTDADTGQYTQTKTITVVY